MQRNKPLQSVPRINAAHNTTCYLHSTVCHWEDPRGRWFTWCILKAIFLLFSPERCHLGARNHSHWGGTGTGGEKDKYTVKNAQVKGISNILIIIELCILLVSWLMDLSWGTLITVRIKQWTHALQVTIKSLSFPALLISRPICAGQECMTQLKCAFSILAADPLLNHPMSVLPHALCSWALESFKQRCLDYQWHLHFQGHGKHDS